MNLKRQTVEKYQINRKKKKKKFFYFIFFFCLKEGTCRVGLTFQRHKSEPLSLISSNLFWLLSCVCVLGLERKRDVWTKKLRANKSILTRHTFRDVTKRRKKTSWPCVCVCLDGVKVITRRASICVQSLESYLLSFLFSRDATQQQTTWKKWKERRTSGTFSFTRVERHRKWFEYLNKK